MSEVTISTTEERVVLTTTSEDIVTVSVTETPVELTVHEGPIAWGTLVGTLADQTDLQAAIDAAGGTTDWGGIGGTLSDQTDLATALDAKADDADLASHEAATTAVHGIADTSALATSSDVSEAITTAEAYTDAGLATKQATLGYTPVNQAGDTMTGALSVNPASDVIALIVKLISAAVSDAIQVQDSSGTLLFQVDSAGNIYLNNPGNSVSGGANKGALIAKLRGSTADAGYIVFSTPGGFPGIVFHDPNTAANRRINFYANYGDTNGWLQLSHNVQATTRVNIGTVNAPVGTFQVSNGAPAQVASVVKGTASQSADLQQWQNSSGTPLSRVDASGRFVMATVSGSPTGTPTTGTMVYDTTNNKLWVYNGGWKSTALS